MSDCPDLVKLRRRGASILGMDAFPDFMKNPANRILRSNQATPGAEGYVFDGIDEKPNGVLDMLRRCRISRAHARL